jgi:fumarate hydratase class II
MMPVMAHNILQSIELLAASAHNFAERCVDGLTPNVERLHTLAEASIAICTALAPKIGYDKAAELAKEAFKTGEPLREVAKRHKVLADDELDAALDLMSMTKPGL